jgi:hypothetical protein
VKAKTFGSKRFDHPQVGEFEIRYETLSLADPGQLLLIYMPADAQAETALNLLATLGGEQDRSGLGDDDRVLEVRRR